MNLDIVRRKLAPRTIISDDLYVERNADRQLERNLQEMGRPAYILVARQMGKTNLLLHSKKRCATSDDLFTYIDISKPFGSARECFQFIIDAAIAQSNMRVDFVTVQKIRQYQYPPYREYDESLKVVLRQISGKLVFILDEIDSLTKHPFSDNIFAQIRSSYFERAAIPEFERLTYVLSGVLEPNSIITDKRISPFNIGEEIYLDDFSKPEIVEFIKNAGLDWSDEMLDTLKEWTGGNPRMTWDVVVSVVESAGKQGEFFPDQIELAARELYLESYNRAPIDHIRELVASDAELRDAVRALQGGGAASLSSSVSKRLYLAGIVSPHNRNSHPKLKCKIIVEALPIEWLDALSSAEKTLFQLAASRFDEGDFKEAFRLFSKTIENGELEEDERNLAYYWMGIAAYKSGDYSDCVECLVKARLNPDDARGIYHHKCLHLGLAYFEMGHYDEGIATLSEVVNSGRRDKLYVLCALNLGSSLVSSRRIDGAAKAADYYKSVLETIQEIREGLSEQEKLEYRALTYFNLGNISREESGKSNEYFELALKVAPSSDRAFIILAMLLRAENAEERSVCLDRFVSAFVGENLATASAHPDRPFAITQEKIAEVLLIALQSNRQKFDEINAHLEKRENSGAAGVASLLYYAATLAFSKDDRKSALSILELAVEGNRGASTTTLRQCLSLLVLFGEDDTAEKAFTRYVDVCQGSLTEFVPTAGDFRTFHVGIQFSLMRGDVERCEQILSLFEKLANRAQIDRATLRSEVLFWRLNLQVRCNIRGKISETARLLIESAREVSPEKGEYSLSTRDLDLIKAYAFRTFGVSKGLAGPDVAQSLERNSKVSVEYMDGKCLYSVKFKKVRDDIIAGRCHVIAKQKPLSD